ncbi:MAG: zinc ribbon domain-containing protein [Alcanivoracaceae bacterium]|nr:zinc ribbon domain-containing protein [Alcanivoracaceae bacterium]
MPASFRLIFRGQIATGSDPDAAASVLARRFRLDSATTAKVMSGRKVALARELSEADAFSLQAELEGAGIITRIETDPHSASEPQAPVEHSPTPAAPPPEPTAPPVTPDSPNAPVTADFSATSGATAPCRQCMRELAPGSSFCPWCGARQGNRMVRSVIIMVMLLLMLAAIGIPLYYAASDAIQARSASHQHVEKAMARAGNIQQQVAAFIQRTNFWPNSNLDAGLPRPEALADDSLKSITVGNQAMIALAFRDELPGIGGHTLLFVPASDSGKLPSWECRGGTLPARWLPDTCEPPEAEPAPAAAPETTPQPAPTGGDLPPANYLRRVLTQELKQSQYIRDKMIAYQRRHGRWPAGHDALDLADPLKLGSYAMRRVEVQAGGKLLYEFSTALENMEGRQITLEARDDGKRWQCLSDLPVTHLPTMCQP